MLNGQNYKAKTRKTVSIDTLELQLNREIANRLQLSPRIRPINTTMLDKSVEKLNQLFKAAGVNVTVESLGIADFIPSFDWLERAYNIAKRYGKLSRLSPSLRFLASDEEH